MHARLPLVTRFLPTPLIVRRVKRLHRVAGDGTEQGELFATCRHHAFITNSSLAMVEADQRHRDHAIVEQVIAELKDGPLAHLPSGKYAANARDGRSPIQSTLIPQASRDVSRPR